VYKSLEPEKIVDIGGWGDHHEAWETIHASRV